MQITFRKILILFFLVTVCHLIYAQTKDSTITPMNIEGNANKPDSILQTYEPLPNLFKLDNQNWGDYLSTNKFEKKEIDFSNYRYTIDLLTYLPNSFQNYFGVVGLPNEPILFNQRNRNISYIQNNYTLSNRWNGSSDLNLIQTERVDVIKVVPISRGFLFNSFGSPATLSIVSKDSLRSKPLSRIRYYQSTNDKALIDALFNAIVHKNLSLELRITNAVYTGDYSSSSYSVWKAYFKSKYRLTNKIHASVSLYHLKSHIDLNGGIDLSTTDPINYESQLYNTLADVNFLKRNNITTLYRGTADIYGNIFNNSYTSIKFTYDRTQDKLNQNISETLNDSTRISNENMYTNLNATLLHRQTLGKLFFNFIFSLDKTDYNVDYLNLYKKKNSYYFSAIANYKLLDSSFIPTAYVKLGSYEDQNISGAGFDLLFNIFDNFKIMSGFSFYNKPFLISEVNSLPTENFNKNNINSYFATAELTYNNTKTSFTYYKINSDHSPMPIFSDQNLQLNTTKIIFPFTEEVKSEGINLFADIKFWKLETLFNSNYLLSNRHSYLPQSAKYNLTAGVYYRNKLFDNNLNLKTGFNFFYSDNMEYQIYDFQMIRSSAYYLSNNIVNSFTNYSINNKPMRLDFTLEGRIQNRATFYFAYENLLYHNYYYIPYYPMPSGSIRFGISWDLIN